MKRILLSILPLFLVMAVFGQNEGLNRNEGPVENGPVIININAYKNSDYQIYTPRFDAEELKSTEVNLEMSDAFGFDTNQTGAGENNQSTLNNSQQDLESGIEVSDQETKLVDQVKEEMKVYPIPTVSDLNVSLGQEINAELNLMNILGQTVYSFSAERLSNHTISVSSFPSGTYFLVINIGEDVITKRVQIR